MRVFYQNQNVTETRFRASTILITQRDRFEVFAMITCLYLECPY